MRVLVTGGAGYVGSLLVPMLLENGIAVRVLDNLRFGGAGLLPHFRNRRFTFVHGDLRDEAAVQEALRGVDAVVHLAAIVGFPACKQEPRLAQETNVDGTINLIKQRHPDQAIVFASTGSNYGQVGDGVCTEETPLNPLTIYGRTKTRAEELLREAGNVVIYRFATAFGLSPRLRLDLLINDFVYNALKRNFLLIYERDFQRTFIHVHDMARSFMFALDHLDRMRDQVYNVGSENMNKSKADIAYLIKERLDFFLEFAPAGEDPDKRNYEVSYAKIRAAGFHTTISVPDGIDEMLRGLRVIEVANPYSNV
jgi:nucleoside-diphosphate-sugar epimerase